MSGSYFYGIEVKLPKVLGFVREVQARVPRAIWTDESKLHVTLLFVGKTLPATAGELPRIACGFAPFHLQARGFGTFNNRSGPRVLYAQVHPAEQLKKLNEELGGRIDSFTPHLTLAKLEDIGDAEPELVKIAQNYHTLSFGDCLVDELRLYQTQGEGRPYKIVAWHRLCGTSERH